MHNIAPDNPVRRRLFDDCLTDQARVENFANFLQESSDRDKKEKMDKWNFDFENEVPLEGDYEWFKRNENNEWVVIKPVTQGADKKGTCPSMKTQNENTPKTSKEDDSAPMLRKRRNDVDNAVANDKGVKRKISFD